MRLVPRLSNACLAAWLLAGCDLGAPSATAPPLPQVERGDGRIAWQGILACADCEAIEVELVLQRSGDTRAYTLTETYLAADGGARFVEAGRWQRRGDLVRMQGDRGSVRAYALLPDGSLQPRDPRGRRFAEREGDVLLPMAADDAP
jgi:copper homeostasis protein (lipoprotein)